MKFLSIIIVSMLAFACGNFQNKSSLSSNPDDELYIGFEFTRYNDTTTCRSKWTNNQGTSGGIYVFGKENVMELNIQTYTISTKGIITGKIFDKTYDIIDIKNRAKTNIHMSLNGTHDMFFIAQPISEGTLVLDFYDSDGLDNNDEIDTLRIPYNLSSEAFEENVKTSNGCFEGRLTIAKSTTIELDQSRSVK